MNLNALIKIATILGLLATSSGQLPRILKKVRIAQIKLIEESKASKWPKGMLLSKIKSKF